MSLNVLPALPEVRQPRAIVKVTGAAVNGVYPPSVIVPWERWSVNNNTFYQADTFTITIATSELPEAVSMDWFSSQSEVFVEILAGFPADPLNYTEADLESLIYGRVDDVEYDPVSTLLTLPGRDLTAAFIDAKTTIQYQNLTSSQVAAKLAASHGLSVAGPATTTLVGSMYARDHVSMTDQRSEWDLLTWLAQQEGFACYVTGKTLNFGPRPPAPPEPYELRWEVDENGRPIANVKDLRLSRSLTVAKGITVVVRSWNAKQKKSFVAYYPSKGKGTQAGKASPFGNTQTFLIERGGLDQASALALAQKRHKEITQHEMKLHASLPADNILTQTAMVRLTGTGTQFDQDYYVDGITRRMSLEEGYAMDVSAKNINPESVPAI
jgi:phage protein D